MVDSIHYLYKITNLDNGKSYIGVSLNPEERWKAHLNARKDGSIEMAKDVPFKSKCEILDKGSEAYIYKREIEEIKNQNTLIPKGYNISLGGTGCSGRLGSKHPLSTLTEAEVLNIRNLYATEKFTQKELGAIFNTTCFTISKIIRGDRWKHVAGPTIKQNVVGELNPAAKLSEEKVLDIRKKYATGKFTQAQLGALYGVGFKAISKIITGQRWASVGGPIKGKDY